MEKLSVIVPIYNSQEYLAQCLDSIIKQTYKDLEIILVDDGSTDNSASICDDFASRDSRIKVFHKTNGGSTSAYILGIEESMGKYVTFVDSDDWIEPTMYEKMLKRFDNEGVNMVFCNYDKVADNAIRNVDFGIEEGIVEQSEKCKFFHTPNTAHVSVSRWNKIYINDEIKDMVKLLDGSICFAEDNLFNLIFVMRYQKKAYYLDEVLYHYRSNPNSVSAKFSEKKLADLNRVYELLQKYDENNEYEDLIKESLVGFVDMIVFPSIMRSDCSSADKIAMIKRIMKQDNFRCAVKSIEWNVKCLKHYLKKIILKNAMARSYYYIQSRRV